MMAGLPVLFRNEPIMRAGHTRSGIGIKRRRPMRHRRLDLLRQLFGGPFLAAFDAGLYDLAGLDDLDLDLVIA